MGCDFYISIYLLIEHKYGISYYALPSRRGWFCELDLTFYDSDIEYDDENEDDNGQDKELLLEYDRLRMAMENLCLTPRKDCVVYCDGKFVNEKMQEKYLSSIVNKMNGKCVEEYFYNRDTGTFSSFLDILKITRKEIRYEPGNGPVSCIFGKDDDESESGDDVESDDSTGV
jgi:hypothetical protein